SCGARGGRACVPLLCLVKPYVPRPGLHSFPTRRSSDLAPARKASVASLTFASRFLPVAVFDVFSSCSTRSPMSLRTSEIRCHSRSEEHTSELQSRENLVCRLLLEKKNSPLELPTAGGCR